MSELLAPLWCLSYCCCVWIVRLRWSLESSSPDTNASSLVWLPLLVLVACHGGILYAFIARMPNPQEPLVIRISPRRVHGVSLHQTRHSS